MAKEEEKNLSGIYKIQSIAFPGRIYIGSAQNMEYRKRCHFSLLKKGKHHSPKLQNHYNKYGLSDLTFCIIEFISNSDTKLLIERENWWIFYYRDVNNNKPYFNICPTAQSCAGRKWTEDAKKKLSIATKGKKRKPHSQETIKKLKEKARQRGIPKETKEKAWLANRGNKYRLGKKHTQETKDKISLINKGRKHSAETCEKMSRALKGRSMSPVSDATRKKMSESHKGVPLSIKHREGLGRARRGKKRPASVGQKISRALKGRTLSVERVKSMRDNALRGENNPLYGTKRTAEVRKKVSKSLKKYHAKKRGDTGI